MHGRTKNEKWRPALGVQHAWREHAGTNTARRWGVPNGAKASDMTLLQARVMHAFGSGGVSGS